MLSIPKFAPLSFAGENDRLSSVPYRGTSLAWAGADGRFFFFRGIRMYQDSNMLEKARDRPNTAAMIDSIFDKFRLWW